MQYDIFISYAHLDDEDDGWVTKFHEKLGKDYRKRTGKILNIFLDKKDMRTGNVLNDRLKDVLDHTAIFLPVLSPLYMASEWCQEEFKHFRRSAGEQLYLDGGHCRIMPVRIMEYQNYTEEIAVELHNFLKEKEILYKDFYRSPHPINEHDRIFSDKISELSNDIHNLLSRLREIPDKPAISAEEEALSVFIGTTSRNLQVLRNSLVRELQEQRKYRKLNVRILPDEAEEGSQNFDQLSATEIEALTRQYIRKSIISIHLFDDIEGIKARDTQEPIAHLQYRMSKEVTLRDGDFKLLTYTDTHGEASVVHQEFLQQLQKDTMENAQIRQIPGQELKKTKDYLLDIIRQYQQKKASEPVAKVKKEVPNVFFVHDQRDIEDELRNRIDNLIFEHQCEVLCPVFQGDEPKVDPDRIFRDFWLLSHKAVILLRNATVAWCKATQVDLMKIANENKMPSSIAICVAEPDLQTRLRQVRSHQCEVIDCTDPDFETRLRQFLKPPHHG